MLPLLLLLLIQQSRKHTASQPPPSSPTAGTGAGTSSIRAAFESRASDTWVQTSGRVTRLLADDNETRDGSDMHQRFLLQTDDGVSVLVAHNINAASRVPIKPGDRVSVRGAYEWSDKGGVIHFTHAPKFRARDPEKRGWIEHDAMKYD